MPKQTIPQNDHRWFIWTIVFLIVSGVSLVSYIMITDISEYSDYGVEFTKRTDK